MKKMTKIFMFAIISLMIGLGSCKKDKDDNKSANQLEKDYFTIEKATFVNSTFPVASVGNAPSISSVFGNTSILEGGSNPVSINTNAAVKEILVGVEGKSGYYKIAASSLKAATPTYLVYLLFSQNFEADNFTILIAIIDNAGHISERETIHVSRIVAGTGKLQISCSWDKPNDIDLHLIQPDLFEIYWKTDVSENGGILDVDSNPICILDNVNNENITYSGTAKVVNGKYIVRISLFSSCEVTENTHYVVTARLDGNLITPTIGKNPFYGSVEAANAYIDGDGPREGETVMEFNVSAKKSGIVENKNMLQFTYPKKKNLTKLSMYN